MSRRPLRLDVAIERLPLKSPFRISGYTFTEVPVAVVTLEYDGLRGRAEAAGVYYLGDAPAGMIETIEANRRAVEEGISRTELAELLPPGGARNALDCALWDLEAKLCGKPVWALAGLARVTPPVTTFTIGADGPAAMAAAASSRPDARALKLKLSGDVPMDVERLRAVRAARPEVWLAVDANAGYDRGSLIEIIPVMRDTGVMLLEQPLPRGSEPDLDGLDCPILLAADESVQGLAEIEPLAGRFDVVNIKLDKCGGLTEALMMVSAARRLGLELMVGNMVGTSLAMAPAFVVAQHCDYVDLDGPTFLVADREPAVRYEDGRIWCPDEVWGGPGPPARSDAGRPRSQVPGR